MSTKNRASIDEQIARQRAAIAEWVDLAFHNTEPKRIARCLGRAKAAENRLNKLIAAKASA
jgi:hypothetical protein